MGNDPEQRIDLVRPVSGNEIDLTENKGYTANPTHEIVTISTPPDDFWTPVQASSQSSENGQNQGGQE